MTQSKEIAGARLIGRYSVRKSLRFELKPVAGTERFVYDAVDLSEDLAEGLGTVKDVILAQHLSMMRRVFKSLPDPLPEDPKAIVRAFRQDPDLPMLDNPNAYNVLKSIVDRCRYNRWPVPPAVKNLLGWSALYMKWHWHCISGRKISPTEGLPVAWAGKSKEQVLAICKGLRVQKPRKASRNRWFDHAPFRLMFDNHGTGKSWLKEEFAESRNFLMKDGERILVGVVPRNSKVDPFTMPGPLPVEESYLLYEESAGESPAFRAIPRALVDAAANRGTLYLFELAGRCLRGKSNLNAMYLRSLLTDENFARGIFHLEKSCEFHCRKASFVPEEQKGDGFRQRFMENKFFITLHFTCNAHRVASGEHVLPMRNAKKYMKKHPLERYVQVSAAKGGYSIRAIRSFAESGAFEPVTVQQKEAANGRLASVLAKIVVDCDANIILDKSVPEKVVTLILRKFDYVVFKRRKAYEDGGVLRGYQLKDRVLAGVGKVANAEVLPVANANIQLENGAGNWQQSHTGNINNSHLSSPITHLPSPLQRFRYVYMTSDRVRHRGEIIAETKEDAYSRLRAKKIRPIRVLAEGEAEPPPKIFAKRSEKRTDNNV